KKEHPKTKIKFNYGGSGSLRKQVEAGADVDVMMSANTSDIDKLKDEDKISEVYDYAENKLIIIKYKNSPIKNVNDISSHKKISLCESKSVQSGQYEIVY